MVNVKEVLRESLPEVKLIGLRYTDADRDEHGSYGEKWDEWFQTGRFEALKGDGGLKGVSDDFVGAMRMGEQGFEYWIGILMAPNDPVPEGMQAVAIPAGDLGVCYVYGRDNTPEIYGMEVHEACMARFADRGWRVKENGWFIERYNCPRFTTPDEKGNVILDYCAYLD